MAAPGGGVESGASRPQGRIWQVTIKDSDEDWRAEHARISGVQPVSRADLDEVSFDFICRRRGITPPTFPEERKRLREQWAVEKAEADRRQAALEAEQRLAEDAARPIPRPAIFGRFGRAVSAFGIALGAVIGWPVVIALVLALALGGLYVLVQLVKWAWTG
jgi:hypothetical protein